MSVALHIQRATHVPHIATCGLPRFTEFFRNIS